MFFGRGLDTLFALSEGLLAIFATWQRLNNFKEIQFSPNKKPVLASWLAFCGFSQSD